MEVKSFSSDVLATERKMASSLAEAVVFETLLVAQRSLASLLLVTGFLLKDAELLPKLAGNDQRFPFTELHRRSKTEPENVDGSDTEDDNEDDEDNAEEPDDDDEGDEDFSGEEGDDDDEGDPDEDPEANGNQGSDEEEDNDDDDEEEDNDDDDDEEEEEEEEDEEEEKQPPAKRRK